MAAPASIFISEACSKSLSTVTPPGKSEVLFYIRHSILHTKQFALLHRFLPRSHFGIPLKKEVKPKSDTADSLKSNILAQLQSNGLFPASPCFSYHNVSEQNIF